MPEKSKHGLTRASAEGGRPGRTVLFWVLAVVLTLAAVAHQRLVGPTRPARGRVAVGSAEVTYRLARSHGGPDDHQVRIAVPDSTLGATLLYRRHKTDDPWSRRVMAFEDGHLVGALPHQPPAGKLVYLINLSRS